MAWYERFLTQEWDKRFLGYSKKMFSHHEDLVNEAYGFAIGELFQWLKTVAADDTAKQTDGHCVTVYKSKLLDYHRHHFGRFRPHKWVEDKGEPWPQTAKLLARNLPLEDIRIELQKTLGKDYPIPFLEAIIGQLFQRHYGQYLPPDPEEGEFAKQRGLTGDQELIDQERYCLVRFLFGETDADTRLPVTVVKKWQSLSDGLALTDNDRLMLKLYFYEDKSYTDIAVLLAMKEHTVRRRIKQLLADTSLALRQLGADFTDF